MTDETKWNDVTDADLEGALLVVKYDHDPSAAHALIEYFHQRIHGGRPYNERLLLEFVAHAFKKIAVDKWSADHAFGISKKRKRGKHQRDDTSSRDIVGAAFMVLLTRNKISWEIAKANAAELFFDPDGDGRGQKAMERAYATYKDSFWGWSNEDLASLLPPSALRSYRDVMNG